MAFRPHQRSSKTPEELAHQRAMRLKARIARALLKQDASGQSAVDEAVDALRDTLRDPKVRRATKNNAAQQLLVHANRAAGNHSPTLQVSQNQAVTSMADLLALEGAPIPRPDQPGVHSTPPTLADPASDAAPEGLLGSGVGAQDQIEGGLALPNSQSAGTHEHHNDTPEHLLLLAPSCRPKPPEVVEEPRCLGCGAVTEPGHLAACPVPREYWPDGQEGGPQDG